MILPLIQLMNLTFYVFVAESTLTVNNQIAPDTSTLRFTWSIEDLSKCNVKKLLSDDFSVGGYMW